MFFSITLLWHVIVKSKWIWEIEFAERRRVQASCDELSWKHREIQGSGGFTSNRQFPIGWFQKHFFLTITLPLTPGKCKTGCFITKHPVVINNSLFFLCFLNNLYFLMLYLIWDSILIQSFAYVMGCSWGISQHPVDYFPRIPLTYWAYGKARLIPNCFFIFVPRSALRQSWCSRSSYCYVVAYMLCRYC